MPDGFGRQEKPDASLGRPDAFSLGALFAFADFEFDALALVERPVAFTLDCGPVDEDVVAGPVNGDEAVR